MAYIAKKAVRFDRPYSIGETIPDAVVDHRRAHSLVEMGLIAPDNASEEAQEPAEAEEATGGADGPAEAENAAEAAQEAPVTTKKAGKKK